jgi:hypothetical protein
MRSRTPGSACSCAASRMASGMPRPESNQRTRFRKPPHRSDAQESSSRVQGDRDARDTASLRNASEVRPCWRVQKSLDEEGIPYEVAAGPWRPKKRTIVLEGTGQSLYTAIRFEDGSWYREELTYLRRSRARASGPRGPATPAKTTATSRARCSQRRQLDMEHLWSRAVATGRNPWQPWPRRKRLRRAKTVAVGCHRLPREAHGKEGVVGSSPSEGSNENPRKSGFLSSKTKTHPTCAGT